MALQVVIVGSLPNLKRLKFSSHTNFWVWPDPRIQNDIVKHDRLYLDVALGYSSRTELVIASYLPVRSLPVISLAVLRLGINFFGGPVDWLDSPLILASVQTLSIIANHVGHFAVRATYH